jgi:hypothetical protein
MNIYVKELKCISPGDREWFFLSQKSDRSDGRRGSSRVPENGWFRALPNHTYHINKIISSYRRSAGLGAESSNHRIRLVDEESLIPVPTHEIGKCLVRVTVSRVPRPRAELVVVATWQALENCSLVSSDHESAVFRFQGDGDFLLNVFVEGVTPPGELV